MSAFECFACRRLGLLVGDLAVGKCPSCGGTRGRVIQGEPVPSGGDVRAFFGPVALKQAAPARA